MFSASPVTNLAFEQKNLISSFEESKNRWGWIWNWLREQTSFPEEKITCEFIKIVAVCESKPFEVSGTSLKVKKQKRHFLSSGGKVVDNLDPGEKEIYLKGIAILWDKKIAKGSREATLQFEKFPLILEPADFTTLLGYCQANQNRRVFVENIEKWPGFDLDNLKLFLSMYKVTLVQKSPLERLGDLTLTSEHKTLKVNSALLQRIFPGYPQFFGQDKAKECDTSTFESFEWLANYSLKGIATAYPSNLLAAKECYEFLKQWELADLTKDFKRYISNRIVSRASFKDFKLLKSQDWSDFAEAISKKITDFSKRAKVASLQEIASYVLLKNQLLNFSTKKR